MLGHMTRSSMVWLIACAGAVGLIIWAALAWSSKSSPTPTTAPDPSLLPGISLDTPAAGATWAVELARLKERLAEDGMEPQTMEGEAFHIHQHLDLFIHGTKTPVPAGIGINERAGWLSAIHVHDDTGIIHVEAPFTATLTLGQVFDIWGVAFTGECIGGYCADDSNTLAVYVNGEPYAGDPRTLALAAHQEIAIVYGMAAEAPAKIPASYAFPAGY